MKPDNSHMHLGLMASALAGTPLRVELAIPGSLSWTDSRVIYVEEKASPRQQLQQVCVQSALLAIGSLNASVVKSMLRRPKLAERYLALEGRRAVAEMLRIMPAFVQEELAYEMRLMVPVRSHSALESLSLARSRQAISAPPEIFGRLGIRELVLAQSGERGAMSGRHHKPRKPGGKDLPEFSDEAHQGEDVGPDPFSSPVGGGGFLGKLLQKMLSMTGAVKGGGSPGADTPTHRLRSFVGRHVSTVRSSAGSYSSDDAGSSETGIYYPEWNLHECRYRTEWCTVREVEATVDHGSNPVWPSEHGLRKPLAQLGMGFHRFHRRNQGDDIDVDAAVEAQVQRLAGTYPDESVYLESLRTRRDLSVMVLLDISGSVAQIGSDGRSVHELQRRVSAELLMALHSMGDRVALWAFHSQGRSAVHLVPVKRFDEALDRNVMNKLYSVKPGAYSRLGAAIRHGTYTVNACGGTDRKLLVVLTDGLAYDHGYEPAYAAEDVRCAIHESQQGGVGCVCISVGSDTSVDTLRRVFGSASHGKIENPGQLRSIIGPLFKSAILAAEVQRRVA